MSSPLITFALFTYKQERFVRAAVEAAFAQTYSPLEIILADDCSPDRTFEIMREMATAYRGNHSVKLNQTAKNGGLVASINSAMARATGELVVFAAGDDVSLPHRVETLVAEWLRADKPSGIASAVTPMDEDGKIQPASSLPVPPNPRYESTSRAYKLRQFAQQGEFCLTGCAAAWSRENWNRFGNLMDGVVNEDGVLSFRAILDRGIRFVPEPLVLYRRHENNAWNTALPSGKFTAEYYRLSEITAARRAPLLEKMYRNSLSDLKTAASGQMLDAVTARKVERDLTRSLRQKALQSRWWELSFPRRLLRFADSPHRRFPLNVTCLLPLNGHAAFRSLLARLKNDGSKIPAAGSSPHP